MKIMYQRILVPVDGSATADRALEQAIAVAKTHAAALKIVFVDGIEELSRQIVEVAVARARNAGLQPESGLLVKLPTEEIGEVILQEAGNWNADLIVLGTHGRRGLAQALLGSVAQQVIRGARVPVLVVPNP
jgi:nucleotide-binding universal stress UspA family protein